MVGDGRSGRNDQFEVQTVLYSIFAHSTKFPGIFQSSSVSVIEFDLQIENGKSHQLLNLSVLI